MTSSGATLIFPFCKLLNKLKCVDLTSMVRNYTAPRQTDHRQTKLNNILVNKSISNEINKEGTFTQGFKDREKIKRKVSQNLGDF